MSTVEKSWIESGVFLNILTMINRAEEVVQKLIIPALKVQVLHRPFDGNYQQISYVADNNGNLQTKRTRTGPSQELQDAIAWGWKQTGKQYGLFDLAEKAAGASALSVVGAAVGMPLVLKVEDFRLHKKFPGFNLATGSLSIEKINDAVGAAIAPLATDEQTLARILTDIRYELNRVRIPPDATLEKFAQVELRKPITGMVGALQRLNIYKAEVLPKLAVVHVAVKKVMKTNSEIQKAEQAEIERLAKIKMEATQAELAAQQAAAAQAARQAGGPLVSTPMPTQAPPSAPVPVTPPGDDGRRYFAAPVNTAPVTESRGAPVLDDGRRYVTAPGTAPAAPAAPAVSPVAGVIGLLSLLSFLS